MEERKHLLVSFARVYLAHTNGVKINEETYRK